MKQTLVKEPKYDAKVQKQTQPQTIQFQPVVHHHKKTLNLSSGSMMTSFKKIIESSKLFLTQKESGQKCCQQNQKSNNNRNSQSTFNTEKRDNQNSQYFPSSEKNSQTKSYISNFSQQQNGPLIESQKQTNSQFCSQNFPKSMKEQQQQFKANQSNKLQSVLNSQYFKIKYLSKISADCLLIGNENQVDLVQFKVQNKSSVHNLRWSINLDLPIEGVAVSKLAQSKIFLWTEKQLHIFQCNIKNLTQKPKLIQKLTLQFPQQKILSIQFVKRNIFLVCCRSHIQIYQITETNKHFTINRLEVKKWNCPQHFEVVQVPANFGNNVKIFYANMREYEEIQDEDKSRLGSKEKVKRTQTKITTTNSAFGKISSKKKDVFGLYFIEIQYNYTKTKVNELKKVYDIKTSLRHEIKLFNISQNIFFMNLKTQLLAVKNGLIIDSVGVNFKFDNCYLKIIQNDILVHILTDKIQFYKLELNYSVMPEKITVKPFDSIYFPRQLGDQFLSILPVGQGYGIFLQSQINQNNNDFTLQKLKKGHVNYWYALTYPVPLYQKLNQIFPSREQIQTTPFETIQTLCDMSSKMGLSLNQSYRYLWRKSKRQTQKDYEILLLSKDYQTVQQQVTNLLKKRAQKWRMINRNQQICMEFLQPRIFDLNCRVEHLQQFSMCHFFTLKLKAYKDIEVERRRFELEMYRKGKETSLEAVKNLIGMFQMKEIKQQDGGQEQSETQTYLQRISSTRSKKHFVVNSLDYEQQQSQIMLQDLDQSEEYVSQEQSEKKDGKQKQDKEFMDEFSQSIKIISPFIDANQNIHNNLTLGNKRQSNNSKSSYNSNQLSPQKQNNLQQSSINLFETFLKTSKNFNQIQEDRKTIEIREKQRLRHELEEKMKQTDYHQIKINIKDYYFYRDTSLKQYFLEIVAQLMAKEHTASDHMKYFSLRVLIRNFKVLFRSFYEQLLLQMIATYKHKISRFIEHFIQLLPYQYDLEKSKKLPVHTTDLSLCQCIWNPIQSQEIQQMLFLSDLTTIQNKQIVGKFKNNLWFKRNYLALHGVITQTKDQIKKKYSETNIKQMQGHFFYLFISKFLQIKINLNKQTQQIKKSGENVNNQQNFHKKSQNSSSPRQKKNFLKGIIQAANNQQKEHKIASQNLARIEKQMARTNQLLKRVQQIYPLMPEHLKGYLNLYFELYNFLETFTIQDKHYSSIYEFLKLRDFQLFQIFFTIQKKSKGFILKHILPKYQDPSLIQDGKYKFIKGIQNYFDSEKSQITDLKTILNRLNGQSRQFHAKFQPLYDCLLEAMMKKIYINLHAEVNLDQLLIYVQNIPFSTSNSKIIEKLLLIQEVHLEMETLKRSRINMSIMEIRDCGEVVIGALVEAELRANKLGWDQQGAKIFTAEMNVTNDDDYDHLEMKQSLYMSLNMQRPKEDGSLQKQGKNHDKNIKKQLSTQRSTQSLASMYRQPSQSRMIMDAQRMIVEGILSSISKLSMIKVQSSQQLKMYMWKCISELQCTKRHLYGDSFPRLVAFVFVTEILQQEYMVPFIGEALQDEDIKEMLELQSEDGSLQKQFRKSVVFYCYKQRLSKYHKNYLESQTYINSLLTLLPFTDPERRLIEEELIYCQLFKQCDYDIPYPLSVIRQIPVLDQIEYHISQIKSEKIDKLDVEKLFNSMQTMRQLVEPSITLANKTLTERIRQFQIILYEFVFFKYLKQKKILLALKMIDKLHALIPQQILTIYCVFIIDGMLAQFNDTTGDLLIKLISYYYDDALELRILLQELITKAFTTKQFQQYLKTKISLKQSTNTYKYFNEENQIFSQQVKMVRKKLTISIQDPKIKQKNPQNNEYQNICLLFDATYKRIEKSSQYIQQNKYFQIIFRLMLHNPFQLAYFIYNKPEINFKALRGFLSYVSQQTLLFNTQNVLKVGSILFIIILNRIKDNFLISQQIKEYEKLDFTQQVIEEHEFLSKFLDKQTLTETELLVYESYLAMRKKLDSLSENNIKEEIEKQLYRVKQVYDKDQFLVNKHSIMATRKYGKTFYLPFQQWKNYQSKLDYYKNNIDQFASYKDYSYQFAAIDKDQSYVTKGEQQFNCPKVVSWPDAVKFNKIKYRHQILIKGKNTRIPLLPSNKVNTLSVEMDTRRERKRSAYLPEEFKLHKRSATNLEQHSTININHQSENVRGRQFSIDVQSNSNFPSIASPINYNTPLVNENKLDTPMSINNPILNFLNMGASFGKIGNFFNQ